MKNRQTLLLDSSFMPKDVIDSKRAFSVWYKYKNLNRSDHNFEKKDNCEIIHNYEDTFGMVNKEVVIHKPSVIRIKNYININYAKVPLTRLNIFKRDNWTCVYCGSTNRRDMTIDHIIPQSKGGPNTWENMITSCFDCNNEKADLDLEEYGKEIIIPNRPHALMLMKKVIEVPEEWKKYLFY